MGLTHGPSAADTDAGIDVAWRLGCAPEPRPAPQPQRLMTRQEIARELGVSNQRIEQLEKQAIKKCRAWCAERGLELEDLLPHSVRITGPSS